MKGREVALKEGRHHDHPGRNRDGGARRQEGWEPVVLGSLDSVLELHSIDLRVPLARVYEDEAA